MLLSLILSSAFLVGSLNAVKLPLVVKTPEFETTGIEFSDGGQVISNAYLSLPYAKPPVGDLRLERPVPLPANATKKVQATELPPGCLQQANLGLIDPLLDQLYPVSEDCLYLNVMTPSEKSDDPNGYPVLVWVHGGGMVYGMSRFYGWQQLAKHFNTRKIIVVGIQYRLFLMGFFALGDNVLPGNLGLWDQNAALKWINQRIKLFGGNPNRVTVWGNSAGSVSVHSHTLSPHSNQLFKNSIQSSGSLYNFWAETTKTYEISREVANTLGCTSSNSTAVKQCIKGVSVQAIWDAVKPYGLMRYNMHEVLWTAVLDNDFFKGKSVLQLTQQAPKKPTIYGMNKGEGVISTLNSSAIVSSVFAYHLGVNEPEQAGFSKSNWTNYVDNYAVAPDMAGDNTNIIKFLFENYYERNENQATNTNKFWYKRYTESQSDAQFFGGITREIREKKAIGWDNHYIYTMQYIHPAHRALIGLDDYTPHAYEYQYLTDGIPYFDINKTAFTPTELAMTDRLVSGFAQFVKTGNPGTPAKPWPKVTDVYQPTYLKLAEPITIENTFFTNAGLLWKAIYALGYGSNS